MDRKTGKNIALIGIGVAAYFALKSCSEDFSEARDEVFETIDFNICESLEEACPDPLNSR